MIMELSGSSLLSVHSSINLLPHPNLRDNIHNHSRCRRVVSLCPNHLSSSSHVSATRTSSSTCCSSSSSSYMGISLSNKYHVSFLQLSSKCKRSLYIFSGVFEKFTERAIKAVMFSQREAKALGKDMVFIQHLLLGLIAEDGGPGGFLGSGITIDAARQTLKSIWHNNGADASNNEKGAADAAVTEGSVTSTTDIPFSIDARLVFGAAVECSRTMGYNFIAPEHIVIGLYNVNDRNASRLLQRFGPNLNQLAAVAISRLAAELAKDGKDPPTALKRPTHRYRSVLFGLPHEKFSSENPTLAKSSEKGGGKTALDQFCVDLTARATEGRIDPVIGRYSEAQRIIEILCRRTKNNPILLGEAGVGKTAIAEGLAINISEGNVPLSLLMKRILSLDLGLLIAGAKERGELEGRVTTLIKEIKKSGNIIVFIDEIHTLIGSGTAGLGNKGSGLDIAKLLKPLLGRGELHCIASTTLDEYRLHFENDKALSRRFQPVLINEPNQEDAVHILLGLRGKYEDHHKCRYTLEAINAAVHLSARYIPDRYLPDKAIDLIDEAGSKACTEAHKRRKENQTSILSKSPTDYWQEIRAVQTRHEEVLASTLEKKNEASTTEDDFSLLSESILPSMSEYEDTAVVGPEDIATVASLWSGIPVQKLTADDRMLLVGLEELLKKRVIGQDEAVVAISRAVKRSRVGLKDPKRPIAAMLFCGPSGVGKTELAKALAACYFGSETAMLRLDMSEYMERHSISKLIGSPPGYVGFGDGGTFTEAIRRRPFTVVLLDEIEKAHPDIFNILLQLFEDGHLTDSQGRRVSFKNALVVMTSNVGSTSIAKGRQNSIGFILTDDKTISYAGMKALVMEELKAYFRPELLNRIDEVVVFHPLEKPQMLEILNLILREVKERLRTHGICLEVSEAVKDLICQQGFDRSYGARPLRRAVTLLVEDPLSESILSGDYKSGDVARVDLDDSGIPVVTNQSNCQIQLSVTT